MDLNILYQQFYPGRVLKDLQISIIQNLIKGNDVVGILATGYGKSICYQLPYAYFNKTIIVISPLIALMDDQQISLNKIGIPSICMNSNMSIQEKNNQKNLIIDCDEHKIIYMTPELLVKEEIFIKDLIKEDKLCLIAIDEAHCISSWGHDFRKDFQQLCVLKEWTNNKVPIFACTATATPKVQKEIIHFLQLNKPKIFKSSFDRKNLYIECRKKTSNIENDILPFLNEYHNDCIIIYAKTRDDTEKICKIVQQLNITCEAYHGGMTPNKRKQIHNGFVDGIYKCIVATIAFGMGIDQNVHLIIHYGLPNDIESYVQEIGRAGRDGKESKCILYWSNKDLHICRILLKDIENETFRKFKESQIKLMDNWTHTNICRKKILLKHFGEELNEPCMKCDNCFTSITEKQKKYNPEPLYYPMFLIMKTLFEIKAKGLGFNKIIDIIRGSKNKTIINFNKCSTFGLGHKYKIEFLKELIKLLIYNNYLREVSMEQKYGTIIMTTENTINWWYNARKYKLENEMAYISWPVFDIPHSFETIIHFLPNNNISTFIEQRKTILQKTLDLFDLDNNGLSKNIESDLDYGIIPNIEVIPKKNKTLTILDSELDVLIPKKKPIKITKNLD